MAVERRLTEIAGPVGGKLHTARSRNDQVATDVAHVHARARAARRSRSSHALHARARRRRRAPPRLADARLHAPPARPAGLPLATTCWPTSGCSRATASASSSCRGSTDRAAARRGRAGRRELRHRPRAGRRRARLRRRRAELDRRGLQPRLRPRLPRRRRDLRDAPLAARRRARAVVQRGVRLRRGLRRVGLAARRSCRRRRTPTPPSCCAPRRRASSAHLVALHGVMHALPLTYNKDLQEDKEHLFDAVDTLELCLAAARGMLEGDRLPTASGWPPRPPTSSSPRPTSPTCSCAAACRSARRTAIVAGLVRDGASTPGRTLAELTPRGARRALRGARRRVPRRARAGSWLESKVSEGGTALARVREQLALARAALDASAER